MNKSGFVASSILYSFLIVFVALIMTIIANFAHNRVLMNRISNDIKEDINLSKDNDISGAIEPDLMDKFVPISWTGSNWIIVSSNNDDSNWYNYKNRKWANAILKANVSSTQQGTIISNQDVEKYAYVWIPRYRYEIFSKVKNKCEITNNIRTNINDPINIIFEPKNGEYASGLDVNTYRVPSAFKYIENNKTVVTNGFWVQKYPEQKEDEAPNGQFLTFPLLKGSSISGNVYSHIIRNTQWGAISYLTFSKYGGNYDNGGNYANNSSAGNETGVYYMNHNDNKCDDDCYGEITFSINTGDNISCKDSSFFESYGTYPDTTFLIDNYQNKGWSLDFHSGDGICETNINNDEYMDIDYEDYVCESLYFRGKGPNGIFSYQLKASRPAGPGAHRKYYQRLVYEKISNVYKTS